MSWAGLAGALTFIIWLALWLRHGGFWRTDTAPAPAQPSEWPNIVAIIPARNEAEGIGQTVTSLLIQDYRGRLSVIVVDDESTDHTGEIARRAAEAIGAADRLTVVPGAPKPAGWAGKMWAVKQGVETAADVDPGARYFLLTDGDIRHGSRNLAHLVARAEAGALDLASLMVRLRCESWAERFLIPAFVFFTEDQGKVGGRGFVDRRKVRGDGFYRTQLALAGRAESFGLSANLILLQHKHGLYFDCAKGGHTR